LLCAIAGPGKLCLPGQKLGRAVLGSGFGGEACDQSGDCRSGACSGKGGYCIDGCCSDVACGVFGSVCRVEGEGWTCRPETEGKKVYADGCEAGGECASGLCAEWSDGKKRCAEPCCSSVECGSIKRLDTPTSVLCVARRSGDAMVHACAAFAEGPANRSVGEPCDGDGQCRGGRCVAEAGFGAEGSDAKFCSDVCCTDASCGAPALFACAPVPPGEPGEPPETAEQGFGLQCTRR